MHHHTDTSEILLRGIRQTLESWATKLNGEPAPLHWILRMTLAETGLDGNGAASVSPNVPEGIRDDVVKQFRLTCEYWDDVRYASLEPITQVWGVIVNGLRVAADSSRATAGQKRIFQFSATDLVTFFRAARDRMEVADELYHVFKAMPAPECQALAALLNVHVDARLDEETMCRLVRLLDHEGPMSEEEQADLASLSATHLVNAAFTGLRLDA
jgi:hypothetical protein